MNRVCKVGVPLAAALALAVVAGTGIAVAGTTGKQPMDGGQETDRAMQAGQRFIVRFHGAAEAHEVESVLNQAAAQAFPAPALSARTRTAAQAGMSVRFVRSGALGFQVVESSRALDALEAESFMASVHALPEVDHIERDALMQRQLDPDDELYEELQWNFFEPTGGANLANAWPRSTGGGIVVAVLDTGYLPHEDLLGSLVSVGYDFIADSETSRKAPGRSVDAIDPGDWHGGECNFGTPEPSSWHGSHVAGTIAAITNNGIGVAGAAPDAQVLPLRVLGKCGGFLSDIADAIVWAAGGEVPGLPDNPDVAEVINMSLGGGGACGAVYQSAIDFAVSQGTTVVVAAGNAGADAAGSRPANCDNVIVVASNTRTGTKSGFSNFGAAIDVTAPGTGIVSTVDSGTQGPEGDDYAIYSGTSMAAPHVAAIVALMQAVADTPLSPAQVESILKDTARPLPEPDSCPGGCGAGIVDANAAVAVSQGEEPPEPPEVPPPAPPAPLFKDIPVEGLSGAAGEEIPFLLTVPEDVTQLVITISGGSGDADLYVRHGGQVYEGLWDCRPWASGNEETCTFPMPEAGDWYIKVIGYTAFDGVTLLATWSDEPPQAPIALESGIPVTGLEGAVASERFFFIEVPEGASNLVFQMSGGTGDADLYTRFGAQPTSGSWDCRPYAPGNNETCTVAAPEAGTHHAMIRGFSAYAGVSLVASFQIGDPAVPGGLSVDVGGARMRPRHSLDWTGGGDRVDILFNGKIVHTGENTGGWSQTVAVVRGGSSYTVCNAGTLECSDTIDVD